MTSLGENSNSPNAILFFDRLVIQEIFTAKEPFAAFDISTFPNDVKSDTLWFLWTVGWNDDPLCDAFKFGRDERDR